jgi:hypothetical protein
MNKRLPPWLPYAIGAALLLVVSGLTLALIVGGKTRRPQTGTPTATSTVEVVPVGERVPRRLDGVLVPPGERLFAFLADKPLRELQTFPLMRPR